MSTPATLENAQKIAAFIKSKANMSPKVCVICGSGLGKLAEAITNPIELPYSSIPNFPTSTVVGHKGAFVFGQIGGVPCAVMQGRFHPYEGYTNDQISLPIRVLKCMGIEYLLLSNAAGGLNRKLKMGDFVLLKDHLNFPGIALNNVLVGKNEDNFGTRFPSLSDAYTKTLRDKFMQIVKRKKIEHITHQGVYAFAGGPTYETPAECTFIKLAGADVVGMSTVPEVIIAAHCGMKVLGVSLVTNIAALSDADHAHLNPNHEEVLAVAAERAVTLKEVFVELIQSL